VSGATRAGVGEVEAMRIHGLQAATGAIKVQSTNGPIELRLAAIRAEPTHIYRFRFVTPLSLLPQLGPANLRTFPELPYADGGPGRSIEAAAGARGERQKRRHGRRASEADGFR